MRFSLFSEKMDFDISKSFPLLTTKRVFYRGIMEELFWFLKGSTDSKILSEKKVKIWDANGSREFLDDLGFTNREEGDLGPIYGFQWRHWGADYINNKTNYNGIGFDQITHIMNQIKTNPDSRRIILSGWNVSDLPKMALPPCHILCQFYVNDNKLSAQLYQRSGDIGLGVPFNIASYAALLIMISYLTDKEPYELVYTLGDAHIYSNHISQLNEQMTRYPKSFPKLLLKNTNNIKTIEDFSLDNFELVDYNPYKNIKMEMAV